MCSCTPGRYRASQARFRTISRPAKPALPLPPALQTLPVRAQPPTPVLPLHRTQVPTPGQTNLLVTTRILRTQHGTESTHRPAGPPPPAAPSRICLPTDSRAGRRSRPPLPVPLCLSCPSSSASSACLVSGMREASYSAEKKINQSQCTRRAASHGGIVTARMPSLSWSSPAQTQTHKDKERVPSA